MIKKLFTLSHRTKYLVLITILITTCIGSYVTYTWYTQHPEQELFTKTPPAEVKGKTVTLRALKEEYFIDYHNMFSQTIRKAFEFPESVTLNYTIQFLHDQKQKSDDGKMLLYVIFDNKENKLIGSLQIRDVNETDPGQLSCWINENYWGGGRFQDAIDLISKTYFKIHPHEKNYTAHVRLWNKRSYHALKKYGFSDVGYYYEEGKPTRHLLELNRP